MHVDDLHRKLLSKVKLLNENLWEDKIRHPLIAQWLENFTGLCFDSKTERLYALYLLSQFMYFGEPQIREALKSLYRDLYQYPIKKRIRESLNHTHDYSLLNTEYGRILGRTTFAGVGNPSESGVHLLYPLRQEAALSKSNFEDATTLAGSPVDCTSCETHYVLVDDMCGSGVQGKTYLKDRIREIKTKFPGIIVHYYSILGTISGLDTLRNELPLDHVDSVFKVDNSYKCFSSPSQIFIAHDPIIHQAEIEKMCRAYGSQLWANWPLGYRDGQLLLGFHHNTPDNTLPIMWFDAPGATWIPVFKRYHKKD